jgi:anti-sigma regulatory factor (Ser/Thr protein kinase)
VYDEIRMDEEKAKRAFVILLNRINELELELFKSSLERIWMNKKILDLETGLNEFCSNVKKDANRD